MTCDLKSRVADVADALLVTGLTYVDAAGV